MHWIELKRKYGIDQPGGELGEQGGETTGGGEGETSEKS